MTNSEAFDYSDVFDLSPEHDDADNCLLQMLQQGCRSNEEELNSIKEQETVDAIKRRRELKDEIELMISDGRTLQSSGPEAYCQDALESAEEELNSIGGHSEADDVIKLR